MAVRPIDGNDFMRQLTLDTSKGHYGEFMDGSEVAYTSREIAKFVEDMPTLTLPNEWVSVEERLPPEHEPVLCIVNGKPKPNITLEEAYQLGSRLTAGSSMNIWTGKMLLSCGGCPFRSRRERRGEDGRERGNHSTYRTEEIL